MRELLWLIAACAQAGAAERYSMSMRDSPVPIAVLKDDQAGIEASIAASQGGELCGLRYRFKGQWTELIYRACNYTPDSGWRGKAPLLWPATGGTFGPKDPAGQREGSYETGGKRYAMPFHGFVQNTQWKLERVRADESGAHARVTLQDSARTRQWYPFGWTLAVDYKVGEGKVTIAYTVTASKQNRDKMPFSIGNHITFVTPFVRGSDPGQMELLSDARHKMTKDARNVPTGATEAPPFYGKVALGDFTANPAQSLGGYEGDPAVTLVDPQGLRLRLSHHTSRPPKQPYVQFNVWGDARAGYFSPEPWMGLQNGLNLKQGLVELAPGETWNWQIEIEPSGK
jgi:galactose mutarotase-like enzyme